MCRVPPLLGPGTWRGDSPCLLGLQDPWSARVAGSGGDQQATKTQIHRGEHLGVHLGAGGWDGRRGRGRNGEGRGRGGSTTDPGVSVGWT